MHNRTIIPPLLLAVVVAGYMVYHFSHRATNQPVAVATPTLAPALKVQDVEIDLPTTQNKVTSPVLVRGYAKVSWFTKNHVTSAEVLDGNGKVLGSTTLYADPEATTISAFLGNITFSDPTTPTGSLVVKKAVSPDTSDQAIQILMPITFANGQNQ